MAAVVARYLSNKIVDLFLQNDVLMRVRFVKQYQGSGPEVKESKQEQHLKCAAASIGEVKGSRSICGVLAYDEGLNRRGRGTYDGYI